MNALWLAGVDSRLGGWIAAFTRTAESVGTAAVISRFADVPTA
jgi:hypothetical protein